MTDDKKIKRIVIVTIVVLALIALTLFLATAFSNNDNKRVHRFTPEEELMYSEILDSTVAKLPETAKVVARISNEMQYGIVYMQDGRLFIFDASDNETTEIEPQKMNVAARVSRADGGILSAKVDADETCIMLVAATGPKLTERGLYRYDLQRRKMSVLAIGKVEANGSGFIVYEKELEVHFNAGGDKISEMLHNENFETDSVGDSNADKPIRRRRSEQAEEEEITTPETDPTTPEPSHNDVILEPVPRLDE